MVQPLEQFSVIILYKFSIVFSKLHIFMFNFFELPYFEVTFLVTNYLLYILLALVIYFIIYYILLYKVKFIAEMGQSFLESYYYFILALVKEQIGLKGQRYFPYIFTIFNFILFLNLLGLTPFSFTVTSHALTTFTLGFSVIIGLTIIGFMRFKLKFLTLFLPKDVPIFLVPALTLIEIISYISRAFSLSIRLFANLVSGHALLNIFSSFIFVLFKKSFILSFIAFLIFLAITFLEIFIACLQAYVFTVLTLIYTSDSLYLH
jgi:F-type H+-transporting ATPase subunit a